MAGGQERALRRRIRSVESTKKITRAMELIAASRILEAQQRVAAARPYAELLTEAIRSLSSASGGGTSHPLLATRDEVRTVAFVVISADRGLAGGYNARVIPAGEGALEGQVAAGRDYMLILCGKKAEAYFRFRRYKIEATLNGFSEQPNYIHAREVADLVIDRFTSEAVDRVQLVYTQFLSVGMQRVQDRTFLPLQSEALTEGPPPEESSAAAAYEFEPSPEAILERLLPTYVEAR